MGQFGGWQQYGGGSQFGGGASIAQAYYRQLKKLSPKGCWSTNDDALINRLFRATAAAYGNHYQVFVDRLEDESFPHTTAELIADWESLLGIVPPVSATLTERQALVVGRWRGANPFSLPGLRQTLDRHLQAKTAFWDRFVIASLSWRYDINAPGNGSFDFTIVTDAAKVICAAGLDCSWDSNPTAPHFSIKLPDRSADFDISVEVGAASVTGDGGAGIVLHADDKRALFFGIGYNGAGNVLRFDSWLGESLSEDIESKAIALPSFSWLRLAKEGTTWAGYHSTNGVNWTLAATVSAALTPRYAGVYARNTISGLDGNTLVFDQFKIAYPQDAAHNVEICEMALINVPATSPADKFFFFVHRDPEDAGTYDLANAQRSIDRSKKSNTLGMVGESDVFLCDDPSSLFDRDIFGV